VTKLAHSSIYTSRVAQSDMPPLDMAARALSYFEFWPAWLFYLPMKIYGLYLGLRYASLMLPSIANPLIYAGGFVGESKSQILGLVPDSIRQHFAPHFALVKSGDDAAARAHDLQRLEEQISAKNLKFPMVMKPDQGERGAGVQLVYSLSDSAEYLRHFPAGHQLLCQQLCDDPAEAGLFYIRHPEAEKGHIFSLTLKYFPQVMGDGVRTLRQLIMDDKRAGKLAHLYLKRHAKQLDTVIAKGQNYRLAFAGTHSKGAIFKDGSAYITPQMEARWDALVRQIPELYFCRFDVRFNQMQDLARAENIKIIEINGAGAEATHIWDANMGLLQAYGVLMRQYKWMFEIGKANKKRGFKPISIRKLLRSIKANNRLRAQYPHTH
jgi:hypothetical protein